MILSGDHASVLQSSEQKIKMKSKETVFILIDYVLVFICFWLLPSKASKLHETFGNCFMPEALLDAAWAQICSFRLTRPRHWPLSYRSPLKEILCFITFSLTIFINIMSITVDGSHHICFIIFLYTTKCHFLWCIIVSMSHSFGYFCLKRKTSPTGVSPVWKWTPLHLLNDSSWKVVCVDFLSSLSELLKM